MESTPSAEKTRLPLKQRWPEWLYSLRLYFMKALFSEDRCAAGRQHPEEFVSKSYDTATEAWQPEEGWAASYHLFDEPTGTLVVEGARTAL